MSLWASCTTPSSHSAGCWRRHRGGLLDTIRSSLGGPTTFAVTVSVRNLTTATLSNVVVSGSARQRLNDDAATLALEPLPPLEPGQTWQQTVRTEIPTPAVGRFTWTVVASGAGSTVEAEQVTSTTPLALYVVCVVCVVFVVDLIAILRRGRRRRAEEVQDDDLDPSRDVWDPWDDSVEDVRPLVGAST